MGVRLLTSKVEWGVMIAAIGILAVVYVVRLRANAAHPQPPLIVELKQPRPGFVLDGATLASGPQGTPVRIVEFFDYECPPCRNVRMSVLDTIRHHPKISFFAQRYPIKSHKHAKSLAEIGGSLTGSDLVQFEAAAWTHTGDELDHVVKTWQAKLAKEKPGWEKAALQRVSTTQKIGDTCGIPGTPTLLVEDGRTGRLWQCNGTDALEKKIAQLQS